MAKSEANSTRIAFLRTLSFFKSSDVDDEIEISEPEEPDVSFTTCIPCSEMNNKTAIAIWKCTECPKHMCDSCYKMHGLFTETKMHSVTRLETEMCEMCKDTNESKKAIWHCVDCEQYMCDNHKSWHDTFMNDHTVTTANERKNGKSKVAGMSEQKACTEAPAIQQVSSHAENQEHVSTNVSGNSGPEPQDAKAEVKDNLMKDTKANQKQTLPKPGNKRQPKTFLKGSQQVASKRTFKLFTSKSMAAPGDKKLSCITSSAYLPDDRLLLVDFKNKSLKIFGNDLKYMDKITFDEHPCDVAVYDSSEVAVSISNNTYIFRFCLCSSIKNKGCTYSKNESFGIDYVNTDTLAVTEGDAIVVYTLDGDELKRIDKDAMNHTLFRAALKVRVDRKKSRAYVSDHDLDTVTCVDLTSGDVLFTYKHESLSEPCGLDVNKDGNVYVCSPLEKRIHCIMPDGENGGFEVDVMACFTLSFKTNNAVLVTGIEKKMGFYKIL